MPNNFLERAYYPLKQKNSSHIANKDTKTNKPIFYEKDSTTLPYATSGFYDPKSTNADTSNPNLQKIAKSILFYKGDSPPNGILKRSLYSLYLKKDKEEIILLEHAVGYRCLWSKIAISDENGNFADENQNFINVGYIESYFIENTKQIEPIREKIVYLKQIIKRRDIEPENINRNGGNVLIAPLLSKKLFPDPFAVPLNWKDSYPGSVYADNNKGKYIYVHDTLIDNLTPPPDSYLWKVLEERDKRIKERLTPPPTPPVMRGDEYDALYRQEEREYLRKLEEYKEIHKYEMEQYKQFYDTLLNSLSISYLRDLGIQGLKIGVKKILQEAGKLPSEEDIRINKEIIQQGSWHNVPIINLENLCDNLVNIYLNYYFQFAKIEGIYLPAGKCTTIRILVTMPKTYAHSNDLESFSKEKFLEDGWIDNRELYEQEEQKVISYPNRDNEVILFFSDYYQFEQTIKNIKDRLSAVATIYYLNEWDIMPSDISNIDIMQEIANLEKFKLGINIYLASNLDTENINMFVDGWDYLEGRALFVPSSRFTWNGSLKINIDKNTRKIKFIEFFNPYTEDDETSINTNAGPIKPPTFSSQGAPIPITDVEFSNYKIGKKRGINFLNSKLLECPFINNSTTINYLLKGNQICNQFAIPIYMPHQAGDYMMDFHYPQITSMSIKQTDITKCLKDTVQRAKNASKWNKKLNVVDTATTLAKIAESQREDLEVPGDYFENFKKGWGSFEKGHYNPTGPISSMLKNDPQLQWLWNFEPPGIADDADWVDGIDYVTHYISAIKEIGASDFMQDVIRCAASNGYFGIEDVIANSVTGIEIGISGIEAALAATLCNPWLTKAFDFLDSIDISSFARNIPIYNPTAEIANALVDYFSNLLIKLVITFIKEIILWAIRQCIRENVGNRPTTPGEDPLDPLYDNVDPKDDISNAINDGNNNSPSDFNQLAEDFSGDLPNDEESLEEAKNRMNKFFEDLSCLVSVRDLCRLLTGKDVNVEVYIAVRNLITLKYPQLKEKYFNNLKIKELFLIFGKFIPADFCDRLSSDLELPNNWRCRNDNPAPGEIFGDREDISKEALDAFLEEIKQKDKDFLNAASKVLDPDFEKTLKNILENTPPAICARDSNGNLIPPQVNLSVPISQFTKMLKNQVDDIYEKFDKEASSWVRTNKTVDFNLVELSELSEENKATLLALDNTLDFETDELYQRINVKLKLPKTPAILDNGVIKPNPLTSEIAYSKVKGSKEIPAYIYKKINANFTDGSLMTSIDSYDAQLLETDLLEQDYVIRINSLRKNIKDFFIKLHEDMWVYETTLKSAKGQVIFESLIERDRNASSGLKSWVRNVFMQKIYRYILNIVYIDNQPQNNFQDPNPYAEINAKFAFNNNISIIVPLMTECLKPENEQYLKELFAVLTRTPDMQENLLATIVEAVDQTSVEQEQELIADLRQRYINAWSQIKDEYNFIAADIQIIESISSFFPSFQITSSVGASPKDILTQKALEDLSNSIESDSLIDYYSLDIKLNNFNYIKVSKYKKYPEAYKDYFVNVLGQQNLPYYNKPELFSKMFTETDKYQWIYKDLERVFFNSIQTNINQGLFLKNDLESKTNFEYKDGKPDQEAIKYNFACTYYNFADLLNLKIEDEYNPRRDCPKPHFLDITELLKEAIEAKKNSYCIEEVKSFGDDVDTKDLAKQEMDETRSIIINCLLKLAIRIYMSDYLLRSYPVYGYYDPQSLAGDELFIDFMYATMKEELLSTDGLYFQIITKFLQDKYIKDNGLVYDKDELQVLRARKEEDPDNFPQNENLRLIAIEETIKEIQEVYVSSDILLKDYVSQELNKNILPKLYFRITDKDINWSAAKRLERYNRAKEKDFKIKSEYLIDDILNNNQFYTFSEEQVFNDRVDSVGYDATYITYKRPLYTGNEEATKKIILVQEKIRKVNGDISKLNKEDLDLINKLEREYDTLIETADQSVKIEADIVANEMIVKVKIHNDKLNNFKAQDSIQRKIFFNYLFPVKRYLTLNFILCSLSYSTRRRDTENFKGSKSSIRRTTKMIFANGENLTPDPNSIQELVNSDPSIDFIPLILDILLLTPLRILKGFCEASDVNVAISSTVYKTLKAFLPNTTAWLVPAVGGGIFWWIPPLPFGWIYYAGALFLLDQGNDTISNIAKLVDNSQALSKLEEENYDTGVCRDNADSPNYSESTTDVELLERLKLEE